MKTKLQKTSRNTRKSSSYVTIRDVPPTVCRVLLFLEKGGYPCPVQKVTPILPGVPLSCLGGTHQVLSRGTPQKGPGIRDQRFPQKEPGISNWGSPDGQTNKVKTLPSRHTTYAGGKNWTVFWPLE